MANLTECIKLAAMDAVLAGEPTDILFGSVMSQLPLCIAVDQKLFLTKEFLILTKNVADYTASIEENGTEEGRKTILIKNSLKKGERVILLKKQGGQKYIVLDKIV